MYFSMQSWSSSISKNDFYPPPPAGVFGQTIFIFYVAQFFKLISYTVWSSVLQLFSFEESCNMSEEHRRILHIFGENFKVLKEKIAKC